MNPSKSRLAKLALKLSGRPSKCSVVGCGNGDLEQVWLKPLDPIDHHETPLYLCEDHMGWAHERNALAEKVKSELVEERKRIGTEHFSEIQELALPQDGKIRGDILDGSAEGKIPLEGAFEDE